MQDAQKKKKGELSGIGKAVLAILLGTLCGIKGTPKIFQSCTVQGQSPILEYVEPLHSKDMFFWTIQYKAYPILTLANHKLLFSDLQKKGMDPSLP